MGAGLDPNKIPNAQALSSVSCWAFRQNSHVSSSDATAIPFSIFMPRIINSIIHCIWCLASASLGEPKQPSQFSRSILVESSSLRALALDNSKFLFFLFRLVSQTASHHGATDLHPLSKITWWTCSSTSQTSRRVIFKNKVCHAECLPLSHGKRLNMLSGPFLVVGRKWCRVVFPPNFLRYILRSSRLPGSSSSSKITPKIKELPQP